MRKTKDIMRRLLAMGLAVILLAGSVQTGAYAEGKDTPEAATVVSESAEESESSTEEVTETEETGKGSSEELSDEETEIATDEETSTEDLTEETSETEKETVVEEGSEKGSKKKETVELLSGTSTYTNLKPTSSDNESTLSSKQVTFNGYKWYIISDDSTSANEGTVTLFAIDPIGLSKFHDSSDNYFVSTVKSYLDELTTGNGDFAGVANAIIDNGLGKLYLLDYGEATNLPTNVRKNHTTYTDDRKDYWLRSSGWGSLVMYVSGNGVVNENGDDPEWELGVRPALKLDLACVNFSNKTFTVNTSVRVVSISGGANATASGGNLRQVVTGAINTVTYTANDGYHFKEFNSISQSGITVTRTNDTTVTVSGTPTASVSITVPNAVAPPVYTALIPTESDDEDALEAKQVSFGGYNWYVIDDDSTSITSGYVTLLSNEIIVDSTQFNSNTDKGNKYSTSDIKRVVDGLTEAGGALADVADAINTVNLVTKGYNSDVTYDTVNSVKCYLLDIAAVNDLPQNVKMYESSSKYWWTRSPGMNDYMVTFVTSLYNGSVICSSSYYVRPVLQLDLSKVVFVDGSNVFMPKSGYNVTLSGGANAAANASTSQTGLTGAMTTVTYTAKEGYRFDEFEDIIDHGIKVIRTDAKTVTVSGTPSKSVNITVPNAVPGYSVTISGGMNAAVSGSTSQTGLTGAMTTVIYTANEGYHFIPFDDITDNGIIVTRTDERTVTVSGTPTGNVNIIISNAISGNSVTLTGGANATAAPAEGVFQTDLEDAMTTVTYTAKEGYAFEPFEDIEKDGVTVTRTDEKTVTVSGTPATDVSITVPDAVKAYIVTLTGGANATVSGGSTKQTVPSGEMTTVTYTAKDGYHFAEFTDTTYNEIIVARESDTTVTVSGTPTADVSITVPDAVKPVAFVTYNGSSEYYDEFDDAERVWKEIGSGAILTLMEDVKTTSIILSSGGTQDSPKILDLNDHGILMTNDSIPVILVDAGYFRLTDSSNAETTRYIITREDGRGISVSTEEPASGTYIPVQGGYITGADGMGVYNQGHFEMISGTILGNINKDGLGSGVCSDGEFVMKGGSIIHNVADDGNAVLLDGNASFTMYGGEIGYNKKCSGDDEYAIWCDSLVDPRFCGLVYAGGKIDGSDAQPVPADDVIYNLEDYGYIRVESGIWHDPVDAVTYTGKAIIPDVKVYYGYTLLEKNKDYTIKFSNNTNVGTDAAFTITGKGNYKGSVTDTFEIKPAGISEYYESGELSVSDIPDVDYSEKKSYKPVPTVKYNGKKLKKDKDFKLSYTDANHEPATPKEPGYYYVRIDGINNFDGYLLFNFHICDKTEIRVSKLTIEKIADQEYTGRDIEPKPVVKYGRTVLKENEDYVLVYDNNVDIGTGIVKIYGMTPYFGRRDVTFKIKGIPMNKVTVEGRGSFRSREYDGFNTKGNKIADLTLTYKANKKAEPIPIIYVESENGNYGAISKDVWCVITYSNIDKAGTATLTLTGVNGCTGTVKKTYKLTPIDVSKYKEQITYDPIETQKYTKSGATPPVTVIHYAEQHGKKRLREGKDYKLSYTNNKQVSDGTGKKAPTVTVKFKGNYKGTLKATFAIEAAPLADATTVTAKDVVYTNKAGNWKTSVSVVDLSGKKLKAGTDYEKTVKYYKVEGETETELGSKDKVNVGDVIKAVVKAKGKNYTGVNYAEFRVLSPGHDISKLTVSVSPKEFTGREVMLKKRDITFKSGSKAINDVEFEIDQTTYKNNINKGKATVVIKGTGEWGGSKTVTYTIGAKGLFWVWSDR